MGELYEWGDKLTFGKHEGKPIEEVIEDYPKYVEWCTENVEDFELDTELVDKLNMHLSHKKRYE